MEKIYRNNNLSYCEDKFLSTENLLTHVFFVIDSYCVMWVKTIVSRVLPGKFCGRIRSVEIPRVKFSSDQEPPHESRGAVRPEIKG